MVRIKEPSTWAGVAALAQVVAGMLPAGGWALCAHIITAAAGAAAVHLREGA